MKKKLNLLVIGSNLTAGASNGCFRSGIYFATANILKELLKNKDISIKLYCEGEHLAKLYIVLERDFKDYNIEVLSNVPMNILTKVYNYFLKERTLAKIKKHKLRKLFYDLLVRFVKPFQLLQQVLFSINPQFDNDIDVIFSLANEIPEIFNKINVNKYTILYDVIPLILPEYYPQCSGESWFLKMTKTINSKDYYFAISDATRNDFIHYFPQIDKNKISTTLLACDKNFQPKDINEVNKVKKKYNIPSDKKYVFSLCTLEPRKNLVRAVKTFIQFIKKNNIEDIVFVLGGGHWKHFIKQLEAEISGLGNFQNKIVKIGYVDDEDLPALYSGAEWFVYTSRYEGFGLPPLEAMSCGCPVITSNNSSLPEVVSDSGIMIDWDSDEQHIISYEKYYYDESLRNEYSKRGLEHSKLFSWENCANKIVEKIMNS